jgi:hypothetical protein
MLYKEFVPYEPSLDMKELGFDEPCFGLWNLNNGKHEVDIIGVCKYSKEFKYREVLAPTFSQAFRWFREKYDLCIVIKPIDDKKLDLGYNLTKNGLIISAHLTYEEAELACLIKLIEIVKNK